MALLKRSPRGLWLPGGQPTIDWTNPITEGLVGCWVVTGEGGAVPVIRDLVSQTRLLPTGTPSIVSGPNGMMAVDSSNNGWILTTPLSQRPLLSFSTLWFGRNIGSIGTGQGRPLIASVEGTSGWNWGLIKAFNSDFVIMLFGGGNFTFPNALPLGASAVLGTVTKGGNYYGWINGKNQTSGSAAGGAITYTTPIIRVGIYTTTTNFADCGFSVGCLWNRQLDFGESALISADPTNFLLFPGDLTQNTGLVGVAGLGAALAAALPAAATAAAALTTSIQMQATPSAAPIVTAAMTTSIRLTAALASASTTTAALTTGIVLQAAAAATAAASAALTTSIQLAASLTTAVSSAAGSLATAIRLVASLFAVGTGSGTLTSFVGLSRTSPHLGVRQRMIARKGRNIILRRGGLTFTDTSFRAFVHAFSGREIIEELQQGDQHVETLADVTPIVGDKLLIGGKVFNVLGVGVHYDGDTLLGYSLTVRGGP